LVFQVSAIHDPIVTACGGKAFLKGRGNDGARILTIRRLCICGKRYHHCIGVHSQDGDGSAFFFFFGCFSMVLLICVRAKGWSGWLSGVLVLSLANGARAAAFCHENTGLHRLCTSSLFRHHVATHTPTHMCCHLENLISFALSGSFFISFLSLSFLALTLPQGIKLFPSSFCHGDGAPPQLLGSGEGALGWEEGERGRVGGKTGAS
jgi:hypothetical protein